MPTQDTIATVLKNKPNQRVHTIAPDATVYDALELMATYDIGALVVTENDQLAGIVSERDYARKCVLLGQLSRETQVSQIMTRPVLYVTPQHTVDECLERMTAKHIRHLPVLERDQVVGMVSIGDLVKAVMSHQEKAIQSLEGYIVGSYPA